MKSLKISLIALATVVAVGGAFATKSSSKFAGTYGILNDSDPTYYIVTQNPQTSYSCAEELTRPCTLLLESGSPTFNSSLNGWVVPKSGAQVSQERGEFIAQ